MNKKQIADFFDSCAPWWDAHINKDEEIIETILDNGGVERGKRVLDVACGTGVLFENYFKRGADVTGVDISHGMAEIAAAKYPEVPVLCADVETVEFEDSFDCIMVYNAFPHFPDPTSLIDRLARLCGAGGRLSIAHGMSRDAVNEHHKGSAAAVSNGLMPAEELAELMSGWFCVETVISNERMYQVVGVKKQPGHA